MTPDRCMVPRWSGATGLRAGYAEGNNYPGPFAVTQNTFIGCGVPGGGKRREVIGTASRAHART
jgi:hypothetical protein